MLVLVVGARVGDLPVRPPVAPVLKGEDVVDGVPVLTCLSRNDRAVPNFFACPSTTSAIQNTCGDVVDQCFAGVLRRAVGRIQPARLSLRWRPSSGR